MLLQTATTEQTDGTVTRTGRSDKAMLKADVEAAMPSSARPPMHPILWNFMVITCVLFYSSYTILVHMSSVDGRIPFSSTAMNLLIEVFKLSICIAQLLRHRLRTRAVLHMCWMLSKPRLSLPYAVPALIYAVNANLCVHLQSEMDPVTYQLIICGVVLAPDFSRGTLKIPNLSLLQLTPFCVPALLYFLNNNVAVHMQIQMDPATYQVLGNFKILTTALLYRCIMKRQISRVQWLSLLLLLCAGIANSYGGLKADGSRDLGGIYITLQGLLMITCYCTISGLAGVYTEYIFKNKYEMSIYIQSGLLYVFGASFNAFTWLYNAYSSDSWDLLEGFTWHTWGVIFTQAIVGLSMGAVMKHASNITRLFMVSSAVLVTTLLSVAVLHIRLNVYFLMALGLGCAALSLYHNVCDLKL